MIIEAKYVGPFFSVKVPGYPHRTCERGETTKLRIPEGVPIGGCWEIVKGKKAYQAGLKKVEDERKAKAEARAAAQAKAKKADLDARDARLESGEATKPDKKG